MVINKKVPYSGKGFIIKTSKGPKALYDYLWSLTEDIEFDKDPDANDEMRQNVHHFIAHIYHSIKAKLAKKDNEKQRDDGHRTDLFIPIYGPLIRKVFGDDFKVLNLRDKSLIKLVRAKNLENLSRYYSLPSKTWETACDIENRSIGEAWLALTKGEYKKFIPFNIVDGERIRKVETSEPQPKEQTFKTPDLVKNAINAISPCVFNPKYVGWWVDGLEKALLEQKQKVKKMIESGNLDEEAKEKLHNDLFRLEKKYINERLSQSTILYQQPVLSEKLSEKGALLYEYSAAYKPQVSGRLTEIGGGMQNASRVFKYLAFEDVKDFYNYDLKASQANILIQELDRCDVDASWVKDYIKDPKAKYTKAQDIGTDPETWKTCLYATFMGANPNMSGSTIQTTLIDFFDDEKLGKEAVIKFREVTKPLFSATEEWRKKIISLSGFPYICYSKTHENHRHWINACKMKHKKYGITREDIYVNMEVLEDDETSKNFGLPKILKSTAEVRRKLAAFILQGQEACFIHHLTILCNDNGIKVMRNEHDGIITDKSITDNLIKEAGTRAKLKGAVLEEKALAGKEDIDKASKIIGKKIPYNWKSREDKKKETQGDI